MLPLTEEEASNPIQLAADIGHAGFDPMAFLEERDPVKVAIMYAVFTKWLVRRVELDDRLANKIIQRLGEAMK